MPPIRPKLSITLPRNFTFHYTDGQGPKTPEEVPEGEPRQPSPPRPYRLRTRRRRGLLFDPVHDNSLSSSIAPQDVPIPTIEHHDPVIESTPLAAGSNPEPVEGLLAPMPSRRRRFLSPPKTPLAQIFTTFDALQSEELERTPRDEVNPGESISRPNSANSTFSNSSESSSDSSTSFPSTGGSCTSPESDAPDPFTFSRASEKGKRKLTSLSADHSSNQHASKPGRHVKHTHWTPDMDTHLWTTYLLYREDPTVTPFRTAVGIAPPLGVCCRIARKAKKTWRGPRSSSTKRNEGSGTDHRGLRDVHDEANAVPSVRPMDASRRSSSGSITPTGPEPTKTFPRWSTSEAATRRRLRYLCKRNPLASNQRYRLLQSRSPTPFQSQRRRRFASPLGFTRHGPSFSTWDMTYSLTASTAASMRPDGALARLAQEEPARLPEAEHWFGQAASPDPPHAYPKSSLPSRVGLGIGGIDGSNTFPRLGSPFAGRSRPSVLDPHILRPPSPSRAQPDRVTAHGPPVLRSPLELTTPLPFPPVLKRRAQHTLDDEMNPSGGEIQRNLFEEVFGAPADSSHRRVRSRGFSLGDVSAGSRVSSVVTPPSMYDQMDRSAFAAVAGPSSTAQTHLTSSATAPNLGQRLGSPFGGVEAPSVHLQAGPSNHGDATQTYDPFVHGQHTAPLPHAHDFDHVVPSIEERLGHLSDEEYGRSKRMRG